METIERPIYRLKVKESEKTLEWYKQYMEYIIPFDTTTIADYRKMRNLYAVVNNDLSVLKKELESISKPMGDLFDMSNLIDKEIAVYNKLFPKYMYLVSQYLKRGNNFEVILSSSSANEAKNKELQDEIRRSVEEQILLMGEVQQIKDPNEQQKYYEQMRSQLEPQDINVIDFKSESEHFYTDVLDYFRYKFDVNRLKELSVKHGITVDKVFVGILEKHGMPVPVVLNPLHFGFHKSPDIEYIQHGDYWWQKSAISITQAYDELKDKVSEEVLDTISSYSGDSNLRPNKAWDVKKGAYSQYDYSGVRAAKESWDHSEKHIGQNTGQGTSRNYHTQELIWKTYMEFKAYREIIFYTYTNENGREVTEIVSNDFPIPKSAVKVKFTNRYGIESNRHEWVDATGNPVYAETLWIPRRYELVRYGTDIYTDAREVPNQPINIDNPFDFELSVKGKILTAVNSESISLVERALPSYLQYLIVKNLQNKEIAKYEGFIKNIDISQIPDALAKDPDGNSLFEGADKIKLWRLLRRSLGESYYDPNLANMGLPNHQKTIPVKPEVAGSINEILLMQQMLDLIDREMGFQMLVPPQAEGMFQPYSNAQDNQQAIQQGFLQIEPYYLALDKVWKDVISEYLKQFRLYYIRFFEENPNVEETFLNYVTPKGTQKVLNITPELLDHESVGIFIHNGTNNELYRQYMINAVQPLSQNSEGASLISELILSLTRNDSPQEIHKRLRLAELDQQKRMQEVEKRNQELEQLRMEMEDKRLDKLHGQKLEQIQLEKEYDLEEKAMDIYKFQDDLNKDQDGVNDALENMMAVRDENRKDRDQDRKDRELRLKEKIANKKD